MSLPSDLRVHRLAMLEATPTTPTPLRRGRAPTPRSETSKRRFNAADVTRIIRSAQHLSQDLVINVNMLTGVIEVKASAPEPSATPLVAYDRADAELLELARRHGYG